MVGVCVVQREKHGALARSAQVYTQRHGNVLSSNRCGVVSLPISPATELEFLNVSWGRKTGVDLSLPLFFSMPIKCGIFEHTKTGVVGDHPNSGDVTKT